jgi:DNA-binding MarR family transcriptional regulator
LIEVRPGRNDRRSKELHLTEAGAARLLAAIERWEEAQSRFEAAFGPTRAAELRALMHDVATSALTDAGSSGVA